MENGKIVSCYLGILSKRWDIYEAHNRELRCWWVVQARKCCWPRQLVLGRSFWLCQNISSSDPHRVLPCNPCDKWICLRLNWCFSTNPIAKNSLTMNPKKNNRMSLMKNNLRHIGMYAYDRNLRNRNTTKMLLYCQLIFLKCRKFGQRLTRCIETHNSRNILDVLVELFVHEEVECWLACGPLGFYMAKLVNHTKIWRTWRLIADSEVLV
jgi:hypothetical protein